jgi:hypothetical protein
MRRRNTNANTKRNINANCHSKAYSDAQVAPNSEDPPNAKAVKAARRASRRKS